MKYAIVADYYKGTEDETEKLFLGADGKYKLFVFDENVTKRTKLFKTAARAGKYMDTHFPPNEARFCIKSVSIVEVNE